MKKMVILVSGGGTNLQRIIDCIGTGEIPNAEIALVVADRECFGLQRAEKHGIKNVIIKRGKDFSEKLADVLPENTDLIVLAGFLSILNKEFCERFPGKIINIHPALLPKFGGKGMWGHHVHEAVKAAGETETGMTVHWVTREIDGGGIIAQYRTPLSPTDTADDIAAKEHELEMKYFPEVIEEVIRKLR